MIMIIIIIIIIIVIIIIIIIIISVTTVLPNSCSDQLCSHSIERQKNQNLQFQKVHKNENPNSFQS